MTQLLVRPRLLPATIVAMATLLVVKSAGLVRAAAPAEGEPVLLAAAIPPATAAPAPAAAAAAPASAPAAQVAAATPAPTQAAETPISAGERALLLDLRQRSLELDKRSAALSAREEIAAAAEKRLTVRLDQLTALQKHLEDLEAARHTRDEASWDGLVKVYEAMKPRDAAVIFNDLEMPVLLQVVDRMKPRKTAPVLAAMLPDRARALTDELAQLRSGVNLAPDAILAVPAAAAPAAPAPGH
jgi:flagellar motility protein MotE (MotC chaperone)